MAKRKRSPILAEEIVRMMRLGAKVLVRKSDYMRALDAKSRKAVR